MDKEKRKREPSSQSSPSPPRRLYREPHHRRERSRKRKERGLQRRQGKTMILRNISPARNGRKKLRQGRQRKRTR